MPKARLISDDILERAKLLREFGATFLEISRLLGVNKNTIRNYFPGGCHSGDPSASREYNRCWRRQNPDKAKEYARRWRRENPDNWKAAKKKQNATFNAKLGRKLRARMRNFMNSPIGSFSKMTGCSQDFLHKWLESKFRPGMNWENYGTVWHVDHIKPVSAFTEEEIRNGDPNFYQNLQPLFAKENLQKGAKW